VALLTPASAWCTPGSITVRQLRGSVGQDVGMSANGARDTQNRFYYDGIEAMDLDSYSFSFSPSVDAIQEFRCRVARTRLVGGAPGGRSTSPPRAVPTTFTAARGGSTVTTRSLRWRLFSRTTLTQRRPD
jgi:hypothetical protein